MASTIVGCFDSASEAREVERELVAAGFESGSIRVVNQPATSRQTGASSDDPGFWDSIKEAFGFADEQDRSTYGEAARRGSTLVSVEADDPSAARVAEIMRRHHAVDIDARAQEWRQEGWTGQQPATGAGHTAAATTARTPATGAPQPAAAQRQQRAAGEEVIPVVEEQLRVGKREVQQGGVRVYSRVTERPVEERVSLREERVSVERRPVNRPISDTDAAFRERAIEATETAEEAVVDKQARVVEEIAVRKEAQQRTETVRDTVRRTDVEVQQMPGQAAGATSDYSDAFATELAADERYRGREWTAMEPDVRRSFEQRYPQSKWDQYRDRVRTGWERSRSRS